MLQKLGEMWKCNNNDIDIDMHDCWLSLLLVLVSDESIEADERRVLHRGKGLEQERRTPSQPTHAARSTQWPTTNGTDSRLEQAPEGTDTY